MDLIWFEKWCVEYGYLFGGFCYLIVFGVEFNVWLFGGDMMMFVGCVCGCVNF